jgi:hypothetical protein
MKVEEFIANVVQLAKYKGDVESYIMDTIETVEIPFSLNDSFTGTLIKAGTNGFLEDKIGERVNLQFHDLMYFEHPVGAERLPIVDCVFGREQ